MSDARIRLAGSRLLTAGAVAATALLLATTQPGASASGIPANKVAASGSSSEEVGPNTSRVVLSETVKINNPTDLILGVTLECAILTQVTNSANGQTERAFGEVMIHVEINDKPVPVSATDPDQGRVVFCNRAQEQQWTENSVPADDSDDTLRQYLNTRTANAFNWMALNVGTEYGGSENNTHKIEVVATWKTTATGGAMATAIVGNRTLILEPVKAANREAVTEVG